MQSEVAELRSKIKQIPYSLLEEMGLSEEQLKNFKNYLIVPVDLIKKAPWNYKTDDDKVSEKLVSIFLSLLFEEAKNFPHSFQSQST